MLNAEYIGPFFSLVIVVGITVLVTLAVTRKK